MQAAGGGQKLQPRDGIWLAVQQPHGFAKSLTVAVHGANGTVVPVPNRYAIAVAKRGQIVAQRSGNTRRQPLRIEQALGGVLPALGTVLGQRGLQILRQRFHIGQRPMAAAHVDLVSFDNAVETVLALLRIEFARKLDAAQRRRAKGKTVAAAFLLQHGVVETAVVRDQQAAAQLRQNLRQALGERRRAGNGVVADAGEFGNKAADGNLRIDQLFDGAHRTVFKTQKSDFGNAVALEMAAGGFQIKNGHRLSEGGELFGQRL